jgi:hypothetical protein
VVLTSTIIGVSFGNFCCFAWGNQLTSPIITDSIIDENVLFPQWISLFICFLFCINLTLSYPLVIYPTIMINENHMFGGWPKSRKRQMLKNLNRIVVSGIAVGLTILLEDNLDKFLGIFGAGSCVPLAFGLPTTFHLKFCAQTLR